MYILHHNTTNFCILVIFHTFFFLISLKVMKMNNILMNALKCRTLGTLYKQRWCACVKRKLCLTYAHACEALYCWKRLCTAGSAIALTRAVRMLVLPHAVTCSSGTTCSFLHTHKQIFWAP